MAVVAVVGIPHSPVVLAARAAAALEPPATHFSLLRTLAKPVLRIQVAAAAEALASVLNRQAAAMEEVV
jgi:hypothetical protein